MPPSAAAACINHFAFGIQALQLQPQMAKSFPVESPGVLLLLCSDRQP
jgi:hypothetical protein